MAQRREEWFGDDFGQKVDLTARIREILRNYPEGTSIFKELIQNADDAGAREVRLVIDSRSHETSKLASSSLAPLQGPALLCYNDAQFSEVDFQSIQRIGDSLKKDDSKGTKTGRFGVGFNSVYHLTEVPMFVSGRFVVMFDPQAIYLPNVNPSNPGKMIDFPRHRQLIESYPDQFLPLKAFGCDVVAGGAFDATLFRFPLRTAQQAESSKLSKQAHTVESIRSQLDAFAIEAPAMLLFLKSVERLSVWEWSVGQEGPRSIADVRLSNVNDELRRRRNFVSAAMVSNGGKPPPQPVRCDYVLETVSVTSSSSPTSPPSQLQETWLVCNRLGGGKATLMADTKVYAHMKLIPWAGVAGRIACVKDGNDILAQEEGSTKVEGLAYCFLPLPVPTRLPVHVNGYFELSSNRRDIWYGDDMIGDGRMRAEWNRSLLRDLIVPSYTRLLTLAAQRCGTGAIYDSLWPLVGGGPAWMEVLEAFYEAIRPLALLHTPSGGGRGLWVTPTDAVLIPPEGQALSKEIMDEGKEGGDEATTRLEQVLLEEGLPVLDAAAAIQEVLLARKVVPRVATPDFVRVHLRATESPHPSLTSKAAVMLLLRYCISDQSDRHFVAMDGLPLLPVSKAGSLPRRICLYPITEGPAVVGIRSMGFALGITLKALKEHPPSKNGEVDDALGWILERQAAAEKEGEPFDLGDFVLVASEPTTEIPLFEPVSSRLLNLANLPEKARAIFQAPRFQQASNVRSLTTVHLPTVLRYVLPETWREQAVVEWRGGKPSDPQGTPSLSWFHALWKYLLTRMNDLAPLAEDLPLLPCNESVVTRLSIKIPLMLLSPEFSAPLLAGLRQVGVLTLNQGLATELGDIGQAGLKAFLRPATRSGVLECLRVLAQKVAEGDLTRFSPMLATALDVEACDALRSLVLSEPLAELTRPELDLLQCLPIFRVIGLPPGLVSLLTKPLYLLDGIPPTALASIEGLLSSQFLRIENPLEPTLLRALGAETLSKITWLVWHFFPSYIEADPALRSRAMLDLVLPDLSSLVLTDVKFLPILQDLPFLPNGQGVLAKCSDMYDPEVEELAGLIGEELFPHPDFSSPETLALLRQLGLRSTLLFPDVVRIARSAEDIDGTDPTTGLTRARALFAFLNLNADRFFLPPRSTLESIAKKKKKAGNIFDRALSMLDQSGKAAEKARQAQREEDERQRNLMIQYLREIRWVPVLRHRPFPFIPWCERWLKKKTESEEVDGALSTPAGARLHEDMWYCSALYCIVKGDFIAEPVKMALGWRSQLPAGIVAHQLVAIAEAFHAFFASRQAQDVKAEGVSSTEEGGGEKALSSEVQTMRQTVTSVVPVVYQMLSGAKDEVNQEDVRRVLHGAPWVFVGDRFVQAEQVAFLSQVNATPYLYSVPPDLACFAPLLKSLGVRQSFGSSDFVQVLQTMAIETGVKTDGSTSISSTSKTSKGVMAAKALSHDQLELAIALVQRISDEVIQVSNWEIFAPDIKAVLARSNELVYDDAPWLSKMQNRTDIRYVHPKISSDTGEKIGIRSVRQLLMDSHSDQIDFGLPTEAFGQSEALTRRLRHILELYPEGPSILSELIQNADDSGASTVRILYSGRQYGTTALLGQKMAAWQGPALYLYNDGVFSPQDFQNIARIGQASKLDKVVSTGRFGLGFNATYHCTDLPSFISAEHLVIFDPHVKFLPGATRQQPGIKIRFVEADLLGEFPDQFEPYTLFGCNLQQAYPGTLFRFPLRTAGLARESEISKSRYDLDTVKDLLSSFQATISRFLLFLRNVDNVEVYVAHDPIAFDDGGLSAEPKLLFRASRQMDARSKWSEVSAFMTGPPIAPLSKEAFYAKLSSTPPTHLPRVKQLVEVTYEEGHVGFDGHLLKTRTKRVDEFMVLAGLLSGSALAMAVSPKARHLKFIPFGGVAAHIYTQMVVVELGDNGSQRIPFPSDMGSKQLVDSVPKRGQAFCFLPLPVDSGLPVFVNGYFELSSNRRDIWSGGDMSGEGKLRSDWNQALLQDVVAPLYAQLVLELSQLFAHSPSSSSSSSRSITSPPFKYYYRLFPIPEATQKHFSIVTTRFYELIAPMPVLWSEIGGGGWAPSQTAMLLDMDDSDAVAIASTNKASSTGSDAARLRIVLASRGCCLVQVPTDLKRVLVQQHCCHSEVTPKLVRQLVREARGIRPPWPANQEDAQFLLVYCTSDLLEKQNFVELDGLTFVPLADGSLGRFSVLHQDAPAGAGKESEEQKHMQTSPTFFLVEEPERRLFVNGQHVLVVERSRLLPKVASLLESSELRQSTNIAKFGPYYLDAFLSAVLPSHFANALEVAWKADAIVGGKGMPDGQWIYLLWSYLACPRSLTFSFKKQQQEQQQRCLDGAGGGGAAAGVAMRTKLSQGQGPSTSSLSSDGSTTTAVTATLVDIARLCGRWPILPTFVDRTLVPMLVRLDADLPLLHLTQANLPPTFGYDFEEQLKSALATLGVRVVNRQALPDSAEGVLSAPESTAYVKGLTITGILDTIGKLIGAEPSRIAAEFAEVGPSGRRALRMFLGSRQQLEGARREMLERGGSSSGGSNMEALVGALRRLPIYESYEGLAAAENGKEEPFVSFCALTSLPDHWLPPEGVDPRLLDTGRPTFIRKQDSADEALLDFVGVKPIPPSTFYRQYLLVNIQTIPTSLHTTAVVKMLSDLSHLKEADPIFIENLKQIAFVPDGGTQPSLRKVSELYDPLQGGLQGLLNTDAFPAPDLCTPEMVGCLRTLGLKATLSLEGIIWSASSVEDLAQSGEGEKAVRRSKDLLRFLDHHLEELVADIMELEEGEGTAATAATRQGLSGLPASRTNGSQAQSMSSLPPTPSLASSTTATTPPQPPLRRLVLPEDFKAELRNHAWVPVRQVPLHPSLPWSQSTTKGSLPLVRPPLATRPQAEMWHCSLRLGIAEFEVSSPLLREALGWEEPIDASTLVEQLIGLSTAFRSTGRGGNFRQILNKVVPEIYEALQEQILDPETGALEPDSQMIPGILAEGAWIWLGDEFLETNRVAFKAPPNSRPYLAQVPHDLDIYAPLLRAVGVRESFKARDLAHALRVLHVGSQNHALPLKDLNQAVGLLKALYRTPFEERQQTLRVGGAVVYAPAENAVMHRIDELCFNDAPWLLADIQGRVNLTFVHREVGNDVARGLGARSLREALLANQCAMAAIPCARARDIRTILGPSVRALLEVAGGGEAAAAAGLSSSSDASLPQGDSAAGAGSQQQEEGRIAGELMLQAITDVLELADDACCKDVEIVLDGRRHGTESLLHPLLSDVQGPALVIHLKDIVIGFDDLIRLTSPTRLRDGPNMRSFPPQASSSNRGGRGRMESEDSRDNKSYGWPPFGLGLSSLFHLTDLVQVLAGDQFLLFDPCGIFLLSDANVEQGGGGEEEAEGGSAGKGGRTPGDNRERVSSRDGAPRTDPQPLARRYTLSGQNLHTRFPDQFAPFLSLPCWSMPLSDGANGGSFTFKGTILRCPLRQRESAISTILPSMNGLPLALPRLLESVPPSLLFSLELESLKVVTWDEGTEKAEEVLSTRVASPSPKQFRLNRREILENREWRKFKFSQLWKGGGPAPTGLYPVEIACELRGKPSTRDRWILLDCVAHGASREAALAEPFKSITNLLPLISAATRLESRPAGTAVGEGVRWAAPSRGRTYSIIDTGNDIGFPCHISAPFFFCDTLLPVLSEHLGKGRGGREGAGGGGGPSVGLHGRGADELNRFVRWNKALLTTLHDEVLPTLMASLRDVTLQASDGRGLYSYWPYLNNVPERQKGLVRASGLYDRLANGNFFFTRTPHEGPKFVKVGEAFFLDQRARGGPLEKFLRRLFPLFDVPYDISQELRTRNVPIKEVTPALLRRHLRTNPPHVKDVAATPGLALELLCFCLLDAGPAQAKEALGPCRSRWRELIGLPILPLDDGSVARVSSDRSSPRGIQRGYIVADEEQKTLLPTLTDKLVSSAAVRRLGELVHTPEFLSTLGLVKFGPEVLATHLHTVLPENWKSQVRTKVDWSQVQAPFSPLWLYRFWRQVPLSSADQFGQWPLVPIRTAGGNGRASPSPSPSSSSSNHPVCELVTCALASHVLRLLPDYMDTSLQAKLEREAEEALAAVNQAASEANDEFQWSPSKQPGAQAEDNGQQQQGGQSQQQSVNPRDICLDLKELESLYIAALKSDQASSSSVPVPPPSADDFQQTSPRAAADNGNAVIVVEQARRRDSLPDAVLTALAQARALIEDVDDAEDYDGGEGVHYVRAEMVRDGANNIVVQDVEGEDNDDEELEGSGCDGDVDENQLIEPQGEDNGQAAAGAAAVDGSTPPLQVTTLPGPEREKRQELLRLLSRAKAPILEVAYFAKEAIPLLFTADHREVTRAIIFNLHTFHESLALDELSGQEQDQLLRRLTTSSQGGNVAIALTPSEIEKLKHLNLFETLTGARVSLSDGPYVVLDDRNAARDRFLDNLLPLLSASASHISTQSKVLKRKEALDDLYKDLGIAALKKGEILSRFLVPELPSFDRDLRLRVLGLIKSRWHAEGMANDVALVTALKEARFVEKSNGHLATPSELLDPRSEILREVFNDDPSVFPHGDFQSVEWLTILGVLGLQDKIDRGTMISCAKKIELLSALVPLPFAAACKAFKLIKHFVSDGDLSVDKALHRLLAPIRCVPVERPGLHMTGPGGQASSYGTGGPSPNKQYQVVSFAEACATKDRNLVWSVAPVLFSPHTPPQLSWSGLGIVSPPPRTLVVQHLINLCTELPTSGIEARGASEATSLLGGGGSGGSVLDRWVYGETPVMVFQSIYKYLEEHWASIPPSIKITIKGLPCVPVGNNRLVKASRLYFRLTQDLSPFMFEVPRAFGAYDKLFQELGTRPSPSIQDYALLLSEVKGECGDSPLNPNELEAVIKVINLLADILLSQRNDDIVEQSNSSNGGGGARELLQGWKLYTPDDRSVLVHMDTCLYDDASWLRGRVHAHLLRVVHPRISLETCEAFGVPRISQVVREVLASDFVLDPVTQVGKHDSGLLAATLTSSEFSRALACLLSQRGEGQGMLLKLPALATTPTASSTIASPSAAFDDVDRGEGKEGEVSRARTVGSQNGGDEASLLEEAAAAIQQTLSGYSVQFVPTLRSRFLRLVAAPSQGGSRASPFPTEEDITSRPEGSMFFVDTERRSILLAVTLLPPSITPAYVLAMAVAQIFALGSDGGWVVAPMSALLASPAELVGQVMELLRLNTRDEVRAKQLRRGKPGQVLQEVDRDRVEFRPMRIHMQGEIIAWQEGQGSLLRYGIIVPNGIKEGAGGVGGEASGGAGGRGIEEMKSAAAGGGEGGVRRLLVRVAPGKVQEMLSTQVYSFKATRPTLSSNLASKADAPSHRNLVTEQDRSGGQGANGGKGGDVGRTSAPIDLVSLPAVQPKKEAALGGAISPATIPVESGQLLAAVNDILSRVNLSLGDDTQQMMERTVKLQRELDASYQEAETAKEYVTELQSQIDQIKGAFQCQICYQRDVSNICAPCGHLLCGQCKDAVRNTCPFCRESIKYIFPFYKPFQ